MKDQRHWIKVTHEFPRHPKTLALSDGAFRSLITAWCYAAEMKTDGFLTKNSIKTLAKPSKISELLEAGFLKKDEKTGGYILHDFTKHQTVKEETNKQVSQQKNAGSQGGKASAHKRWHADKGIKDPECDHCQAA